jgi:hypothetical protein
MAKRTKQAKAEIKIRLTEALRAKIERAARTRGISMNSEMIEGLDRYYADMDAAGGPEIAKIIRIFGDAFSLGGRRGTEALGHSDWKPDRWVTDQFSFKAAVVSAFDAVKTQEPQPDRRRARAAVLEQWDEWAATVAARGGKIKVTRGDKS